MYRDAPIEVVDLKVKGQIVSFDKEFDAGPEWLKDVSLKIKNSSEKNIVCIFVNVVFRETTPYPSSHLIIIGQPTNTTVARENPPLELKPNEVFSLSLADEYKDLRILVEHNMPIGSVRTLNLEIDRAYFDDGTMWDLGGIYRPNLDIPGKWIQIKQGVLAPPQ